MNDDEARKKILARRATFVAAALAGVSTACGKEPQNVPQPCLSVPVSRDAGPEPCLSVVAPAVDAGAAEPSGAGATDLADAGGVAPTEATDASTPPRPTPCLRVAAPPSRDGGGKAHPRPCLSIRPPSKTDPQDKK